MEDSINEIRAHLLSKDEDVNKPSSSSSSETENSPIRQVALTVPTTDDPSLPVLTFRMWVLGTLSCVLLSFLNQFFWYRTEPLTITAISAQIAVVPLGRLMASKITDRVFFKGTRCEFTLNPGPFNVKEHVLITIFANSGAGSVYAIHVVTVVRVFYKQHITFFVSLIVILTTQILGFGWAGIFRRYLVEPAAMWWPANLVQVSLFRALHEKEERAKGGVTRTQFFLIAIICSFAYYVFPGYLFQMLTSLSWICWIFPKSVLVQQLGSGLYGLGIGAIGLDWSSISSYLGSPLASPWFATANVAAGFVLVMYIMTPISYWFNLYSAKTFPIFSNALFSSTGQVYNITSIIDSNFHLDVAAYEKQGPLHLSTFFAMSYGVGFAALTATIVHVGLFHGREIWEQSRASFSEKKMDIHTRLMSKYKQVPEWWFVCILLANISATIFACEYFNEQLQLPWWGVLLACGIAFVFTLPIGIITAITNQAPGLNIITEYIIGYIYPGYPVANMCFKVYGYISMTQAITFLQDFKLGHYMKIPPRTMFMAQIVGTLIACFVYLVTAWWLMETIPDICTTTASNSVWTCPSDTVFYDASVIWGLVAPRRIFGDLGTYQAVNWFFLAGAIAPVLVWLAAKAFPRQEWIKLINMPVLISATSMMPPATAVNYTTWIIAGFLSGFVVYSERKSKSEKEKMSGEIEEDDERRRQRKLEEALEVKSLRRIISAYLNYPEAAEEDVRRYERSFKKLPPAHKALLSHYPLKYQTLRRCISMNSYFIFTMLQAFEPPLDMSQDVDGSEDPHLENFEHEHYHSEERKASSCQSASTSGRMCCSNHAEARSQEKSNLMSNPTTELQEVQSEHHHEPISGSGAGEVENNKEIAECCGDDVTDSNGNVFSCPHDWLDPSLQLNVPLVDVDKVRCIIRNIVRDWAEEGKKERDQCYKPILEELDALFPNRSKESPPACLVPGAGLGRLALEISCRGFLSQGNEFSYYMMICSSFILNHAETTGQWTIYPWIHSNCNSLSDNDQLRPVPIPDIHPASAGITEGFSMCGGDFVEVYNDPIQIGVWDAVVTCFFIDTAHNIIEYVEIISRILKEGGVWINFGPLLYHFADMYGQEDMSIELSLEDVKKIAFNYGFELEKEQTVETTYTTNPRSMMQNHYHAAFWTMRKKRTTT